MIAFMGPPAEWAYDTRKNAEPEEVREEFTYLPPHLKSAGWEETTEFLDLFLGLHHLNFPGGETEKSPYEIP